MGSKGRTRTDCLTRFGVNQGIDQRRHLERVVRRVQLVVLNQIFPVQDLVTVHRRCRCPSTSTEWMDNWMDKLNQTHDAALARHAPTASKKVCDVIEPRIS
jgi:hypothetical protein